MSPPRRTLTGLARATAALISVAGTAVAAEAPPLKAPEPPPLKAPEPPPLKAPEPPPLKAPEPPPLKAPEPPTLQAAREERPLLQGPHPFAKDNELSLSAGYGMANFFGGMRAGLGYGFQAAGSLWLDLRVDLVDGRGPGGITTKCACARVNSYADVLAGLRYKLRMNVPVIPSFGVAAGPVFLFNQDASDAIGFAVRGSVGAKYFLYDWLGFGLELGALIGGSAVDNVPGLERNLRILDVAFAAEVQF